MITKKEIGKGNKQRVVVQYSGIDYQSGKRQQKQQTFQTNQEANQFIERLTLHGSIQVDRLKDNKKDVKTAIYPWNVVEATTFIKYTQEVGQDKMYAFELSTGLRLGELLALTWDSIDFNQKTVTVSKSLDSSGNRQTLMNGRTISLPSHIIDILHVLKDNQDKLKKRFGNTYHDLNLVFPKQNGDFQHPKNVRRQFEQLIECANVRPIPFSHLRHSYANILIQSRVPLPFIQSQLGHKKMKTTLKLYGPLMTEYL